jgi:hypothetical protein
VWEGRGLGDDIVEMPPSLVAVAVTVSSREREAIPSHPTTNFHFHVIGVTRLARMLRVVYASRQE